MGRKNRDEYNEYMRNYMLKRYHERMSKARIEFGNKCFICNSIDNLEFDHIDPSIKDFTIGRMWSVSESKFREELSKCQLLCGKCHIEKHESKHLCGTPNKYWSGCRCVECTKANSIYSRKYKKTRLRNSMVE